MHSYHRVTIGKSKTKLYEWNSIGSWHRTERRYSRYSYSIGGVSIILMGVSAVDLSIIKISDLMSTPALHRKWYFMKSLYSMESTKYKNNYLKCKNYNCSTIRKRQYYNTYTVKNTWFVLPSLFGSMEIWRKKKPICLCLLTIDDVCNDKFRASYM